MNHQPLIIGHRGASAVAPENTLAAFSRALADGADGIEFDVRRAQDGVPVIIHDASLMRTAQIDSLVAPLTSTELVRLDVGTWFNRQYPRFARDEYTREKIPTLEAVFRHLHTAKALLYLEMKCNGCDDPELAVEVVNLVRAHAMVDRVIVESFELTAIHQVKRIDSRIRTAALFEPSLARPVSFVRRLKMVGLALDCGADEIAFHRALVDRHTVAKAKTSGLKVVVWTVDRPDWIKRGESMGIDALITNDPAQMLFERTRFAAD
jgi:glycerophosphoryl diester phosphodiesterase